MGDFNSAIRKFWKNAPASTIAGVTTTSASAFTQFEGMSDKLVQAHFGAQITHECGAGRIKRESLNYSSQRMMEIFGVGVHSAGITEREAMGLAHDEKALAERVYGLGNPKKAKELGNIKPGDGYLYRGNGMLQLTGRASHARIGKKIGYDLENHPELMADPKVSFLAAVAEFIDLKCIPAAEADNVVLVTKRVNGGRNGLAERTVWLRKFKEEIDELQPEAWAPRGSDVGNAPALLSTRTGQIGTATGVVSAVGTGASLVDKLSTVQDTVQSVTDQGSTIVQVVKPIFGLPPGLLVNIAIGCGVAAVIGVIGILIYRWIKIQNEAA